LASRPRSRHLADLVGELAAADSAATAVVDAAGELTYGELDARVEALAMALTGLGLGRGGTLGLLSTNRWEWVVAALAAHRLGARVAAFNTFAKAWDLRYMLSHSGAEVLVAVDAFRSRDYRQVLLELIPGLTEEGWEAPEFERLREVVVIGDRGELAGARQFDELLGAGAGLAPEARAEAPWTSAGDQAFVLYTSGSSARPKAVPLLHYGLIENGFSIGERMGLTAADRVFVAVPLFWAYGAANALQTTLTHGATMVLQQAFEPEGALDLTEEHRCTAIYTLPNMTAALLDADGFEAGRVATLRTGLTLGSQAEILRTAEALGVEGICNIYGSTETYGNCCVTPAAWPLARRAASQGPPLPGVTVRIVGGEDGAVLGPDAVGEIEVRGYLAGSYLDDVSGAGAAFGADGWFRTGDLGSLDDEGALHFHSRATEMIKTGGINVAPREVEEYIGLHPRVAAAAVVGVADEGAGEVVVAFVVPAEEGLTETDLRRFCADGIAGYKVPARVHLLDELPATDTGKLARRRLVEIDGEATGGRVG